MPDVIDRAMMTHAHIKQRLCVAIRNPGTMELADIRSDRLCAFGLWIYGEEGRQQTGTAVFTALKTLHAQFHEAAYQAALAVQQGRLEEAQASIRDGKFETASRDMTQALMHMKTARLAQQEADWEF